MARYTEEYFKQERLKSIQWARAYIAQGFIGLDTETTGMTGADEIIQITLINSDGMTLMSNYTKPSIPVDPAAAAVHGITDEKLVNALTYEHIHPMLCQLVKGQLVVAYNLEFDRRMIRQTAAKFKLPPPAAAGLDCAMLRYAAFKGDVNEKRGGFRWHKLDVACNHLGIIRNESHEAGADVMDMIKVIYAMSEADS